MKVASVLAPDFEDSEFSDPYNALLEAGHEVTIIGLERGATLAGKKGKATAVAEKSFEDVSPDQFDALLIPGGGRTSCAPTTPR
jgi:protease I